jgi:hypothetical protein
MWRDSNPLSFKGAHRCQYHGRIHEESFTYCRTVYWVHQSLHTGNFIKFWCNFLDRFVSVRTNFNLKVRYFKCVKIFLTSPAEIQNYIKKSICSTNLELSTEYTNHCIRATTITLLNDSGFESRHIVTVSGHKNQASLTSYCYNTSGILFNKAWFLQKRCTRLAAASDKVYQLLAHDRWLSPGTLASSTTKTGRHDIAEILLKVVLNTINQNRNW